MRRPRTTAVWPTAGAVPSLREVVSSSAAQRNSFFSPRIITAWRNEVISHDSPKPEELMKRSRLNDSVGVFLQQILDFVRTGLLAHQVDELDDGGLREG